MLEREQTLIILRWAIVVLAPLLIFLSSAPNVLHTLVILGLFIPYTVWLNRRIQAEGRLPVVGIVLDLVLVSALVHVRGPQTTDAYLFYYIVIVMAGASYGLRMALITSAGALVGYATAAYLAAVPTEFYHRLAIRTIYFLLFAWLSGLLVRVEQLAGIAYTDALTGLGNRRYFFEQLERDLQRMRQVGLHVGVLFVDLDGFKGVNDTMGHATGDEVLKRLAEQLNQGVRQGDSIARLGGDEFAVILAGIRHPKDASMVARRLQRRVGLTVGSGKQAIHITASIGIAVDDGTSTPELLLQQADHAMYEGVKKHGGNDVSVFSQTAGPAG